MTDSELPSSPEPEEPGLFDDFPTSVQRVLTRFAVVTLPHAVDLVARLEADPRLAADAGVDLADLAEAAERLSEAMPVRAAPPSPYAEIPSGVPSFEDRGEKDADDPDDTPRS
ncbi:hypothetical protein JQT66_16915 [Sulfitobacter mediterraneus]|uniref:hypothetical protein n=1 Tax=Sulfitobacter mediterraneus TaxID=83219 RepID=UPI001932A55B|nr:hypothetical protein [Sulfitobacter mediterraneus]MBM1311923.1 hypothetical protein [Sulfitobacter mediterraneus]MBM1315804.1 hypothetical protein [Sulfitobacter mediterraneus]MBM1324166.1 hypothetical protein [Sulfitobacter mediterraneus]MBM1328078.1 hypothetical protein [Sulfitobacter mediterraneus]MBM1399426.1 hypothetical protein [Sulfitobacter mediterraneus]